MDEQKTLDEARRLVDGDDVPLWAVAAALQLGYTGSVAFHVAEVILKWHDLHGNGQELALAEAGALEMRQMAALKACANCFNTIRTLPVVAIARRAVEQEKP